MQGHLKDLRRSCYSSSIARTTCRCTAAREQMQRCRTLNALNRISKSIADAVGAYNARDVENLGLEIPEAVS